MPRRHLSAVGLACVPAAAVFVFLLGINWGLPSRTVDRYLFGNHSIWSGEKIVRLAPADAGQKGADVDVNPIGDRSRPVILNQTDAQRAEIIRRYRLYTHQPDEMITLRSLSQIRQHHGDPRLYQYGGLWVYPVGALIRSAMAVGIVPAPGSRGGMTNDQAPRTNDQGQHPTSNIEHPTSNIQHRTSNLQLPTSNPQPTTHIDQSQTSQQAFYIDHPEAFARFYVIARLYSAAWGLIAVWAVYWIVKRLAGGRLVPALAAITFALMPVTITMSHEAKPHLPGLTLTLLAVMAATKFVESGRARWGLLAGALCGGAMGMVLSGLLALVILPAMVLLRRDAIRRRVGVLIGAIVIGVLAYFAFNPFVLINAIGHRDILRSNLGNSTEMYHLSGDGLGNAIALLVEGISPVLAAAGVVGAVFLLLTAILRTLRPGREISCPGRGEAGWLLACPAALVLIQFLLLAADKAPEYARFALLPDAFLLICGFAAVGRVKVANVRGVLSAAMLVLTLPFGASYLAAFVRDCGVRTPRLIAADRLERFANEGARTIRVASEPAPYDMPPVDLFRYQLILAPARGSVDADVLIAADPARSPAPISWAGTRFDIASPFDRLRQIEGSARGGERSTSRRSASSKVSSP